MVVFDTDLVISLSQNHPDAKAAYLKHAKAEKPRISCFTWYELLSGICRTKNPGKELRIVHSCIPDVAIIHCDDTVSTLAGKFAAMQADNGKPIGLIDTFIAASCVVNGQTLVTRNAKHFKGIPGLKVETW